MNIIKRIGDALYDDADPYQALRDCRAEIERLESRIADLIADAVAKEREACAQISEGFDKERPQSNYGRCIAVDIRARGRGEL